jgi:hypothetical protein
LERHSAHRRDAQEADFSGGENDELY